MELRQLEYFVAVHETANFTRAAERVHISQSGVSAQIRQLEQELGQPLFDRSGKAVRLTEAGNAVLPHARAALAATGAIRQAVDELTGLQHGRVSVGMVTACSVVVLFDQLADFHRTHPGIDITLSEGTSDLLVDQVLGGQLDMALVGLAGTTPTGIESLVIADEALVAAVPHGDPLADRTSIPLQLLQERDLVCLPRGTGVRTAFDNACAARQLQPRVALEASAPDVVAGLAVRGLGVAILSESMAASRQDELHSVMITGPRMRGRLELVWKREGPATPAATALITHAKSRLASRRLSSRAATA
jgi:DNA-binding transcriptional LysR family regulator